MFEQTKKLLSQWLVYAKKESIPDCEEEYAIAMIEIHKAENQKKKQSIIDKWNNQNQYPAQQPILLPGQETIDKTRPR